ncbi:MAG: 2-oxo acid dehydrogenase subunit E2, partial [Myxococcales bacterium]|nr:2-oxo acid dehydrogenase subunit E2 [Myxococcales bacterium]
AMDLAAGPAAPPPEGVPPAAADRQAAMRRAIAAAMSRSKREIPHYYLATTLDASKLLAWLGAKNAERAPAERVLPAAAMLRGVALALREVPELNGFWIDDHAVPSPAVHLGVAISLRGGGLVAPALRDAADKDVDTLMRELKDLVARARSGGLRSSELADPTVTVTNLGDPGVVLVRGVMYPPQLALVGLGKIVERPWAEGGLLGVRSVVTITLAADHRASDGHRGGRFLTALEHKLAHPEEL